MVALATMPLPLPSLPETRWCAADCCVQQRGEEREVFIGGTLIGTFGPKDYAGRNLLILNAVNDAAVKYIDVARAFEVSVGTVLNLRQQAQREGVVRPLFLVYSNRRPEDAAFLAELQDIEHEFKAFHLVATMTDMEHSGRPWNGRRGMIDAELLKNVAGPGEKPVYYLAGPPGMVDAAMQILGAAGVAKEDIRYEEFFGY